jgi:glyoxylase-like metal-dependent hydrolase (beta-lactamase superfamily II)
MPKRLTVGDAHVTVLSAGRFYAPLAELMTVPAAAQTPLLAAELAQPRLWPCWAVHIALGPLSILVDPGAYAPGPDDPWGLPFPATPVDLGKELETAGIAAEAVTHVIITHAHEDHYTGVVYAHDGVWQPRFPAARHYLGRSDWDELQKSDTMSDPGAGRILEQLHDRRLLERMEGIYPLADGITLIPAPGETPGHYLLRLHSCGQTLYCLGDLYHHPLEVEHPAWVAPWADPMATRRSRHELAQAALAEDALLIASHIPTVGRLVPTSTGVSWRAIADLG